jgi:hypothetical protein
MQAEDLLQRLRTFALRSKSPIIDISGFIRSLPQDQADPHSVETAVKELSFRGDLSVTSERGRLTVVLPDFPVMALVEEYRRVETDPSLPFPREDTVPVPLLEGELAAVEAKGDLGKLLEAGAEKSSGAVKLLFPENVPPMVVPRSRIGPDLIEAAVSRISRYLQDPRDAAFMESKLLGVFKGAEAPVRQALEDIALRPRKAASTVMSPTEFSFRFWGHLSNKLVADIGAKSERTDLDQALLQSAYLVAYASFHQKGAAEREKERAADRKGLEQLVRRPPYVFSATDMLLVKDGNGAVLSVKHGREFITSFLEESSTASDEESLPFLVRAHAASQKTDYYIQRDFIVPVFLKSLGEAGDRLRVAFVREWVEAMRKDRPPEICRSDSLFRKEVDQRVRAEFPVISALAHAPLLRLAAESPFLVEEARTDLERCFSRADALRSMHALVGLSRQRLFTEARSYLPFWQTAPLLGGIARFLMRLFRRREAKDEEDTGAFDPRAAAAAVGFHGAGGSAAALASPSPGAAASARGGMETQELERFRRALRTLISQYVPPGASVSRTLEELADRWNPLIEPGQKGDLVKDVNALARDFLRPVRRSLLAQPPDQRRITALAEQLAASKSLAKIIDREPLLRYLSLYMLQTLLTQ